MWLAAFLEFKGIYDSEPIAYVLLAYFDRCFGSKISNFTLIAYKLKKDTFILKKTIIIIPPKIGIKVVAIEI